MLSQTETVATRSRLHCLSFPANTVKSATAWSILHLAFLVAMEYLFYDYPHFDNNYANKTLPFGPVAAPQHFDCHERNTGIRVAVATMVLSLVLMPIALSLDPMYGLRKKRNGGWGWLRS